MPANLDFGRSFTFMNEDPEWVSKVLIGGAFVLACSLLVGIPFVLGYFSRTLQNVAAGFASAARGGRPRRASARACS